MLDARYHLFYSIAVILMLGFGILIGASYYGPIQVGVQKKALHALADETNAVVQQRNQIQGRLNDDEGALASLRSTLVHGKLAGKRVVLIQTGDYADATESANETLEEAGATVSATVVLTSRWGNLTARQRSAFVAVTDAADPAAQDKALLASLASALALGTSTAGANAALVTSLQQAGLVTLSGDLSQPCTQFVVVGGGSSDLPTNSPDAALLDGFKALPAPVTVVGCEPYSAVISSIPGYQAEGISTVDCIDLPLGQIALPSALAGEAGDYGIKPTAKQQLPDSLRETAAP